MVSAGHVGGTRCSGIVSSASDVLWMRGVGELCEMCMCLARGGVGGEWMKGLGLDFTNPLRTGGACTLCVYFCCSECNVVSNECNEPTSCLVLPIGTHSGEVMYFGCVCFRGELGFLNCDDIYMCVVNTQFELLEIVFDSVYVDLQYDEISLTFTAGHVSLWCVCSHVVVFGLSVRLSWYHMWMWWLL